MEDSNGLNFKKVFITAIVAVALVTCLGIFIYFRFFTQEAQNRLSRTLQNWRGIDGTCDIYSDGKLIQRFVKIDKFSTAMGTEDGEVRPYRYAWGIWDKNLNHLQDLDEKEVYFEVSIHTTYIFYQEGE